MVTVWLVVTRLCVIVNVAAVAPLATLTVAGTTSAAVFELFSETDTPEEPAEELITTVPLAVACDPPTSEVGVVEILTTWMGSRVTVPVTLCVPSFPSTTAFVATVTDFVPTANVAEELPAGMVTNGRSEMLELLEEIVTFTPPDGASPDRFTVPVVPTPPITVAGLKVMLMRVAGVNVSDAVLETPLRVAVIVAVAELETPVVATLKVAEVAPAATVTFAGVVAGAPEALRVTVIPPAGAAVPSVTVPTATFPPTTEVGLTLTATNDSD